MEMLEREIEEYVRGLGVEELRRELGRYQAVTFGMEEDFMRERLKAHLMEERKQAQGEVQEREKAYRRLWMLFKELGLESLEAQDQFIREAREWWAKQRQQLRKRLTELDILAYLEEHPDLLDKILRLRK